MQGRSSPSALQALFILILLLFAALIPGQLLSYLRYNQALGSSNIDLNTSKEGAVDAARETVEAASQASFAGIKAAFLQGVFFSRLSDREMPLEDKLLALCKALSGYGLALHKDPRDARSLVRWASLRQVLGNIDCAQPYSQGDALQATRYAVKLAPYDPRVNYLAGKNFMWAEQREEAWQAFKNLLSYGTNVEDYKKDYIASLLRQGTDLPKLLPAKFPQIVEWSERLLEQDSGNSEEFFNTMSGLQQSAILDSIQAYNKGSIPAQVHIAGLAALRSQKLHDSVLRLLNLELARLFSSGEGNEGQPDLPRQSYFEELARLRTVPLILASSGADTRPAKTALRDWGNNQLVRLNQFYQTAGFYVPGRETLRVIELSSVACPEHEFLNRIKMYRSHDNQDWEEVQATSEKSMVGLEGQCLVQFSLPQSEHRYFKINYASAQGEGQFANLLSRLVTGYAAPE